LRNRSAKIWGFQEKWPAANPQSKLVAPYLDQNADPARRADSFFARIKLLVDAGIIEWVPHVVEGDGPEAEIIHAIDWNGTDEIQDRLGSVAHKAGMLLACRCGLHWAKDSLETAPKDLAYYVPAPRSTPNIQIVGIARLRYRAHTKVTTLWFARLNERGEQNLAVYNGLIAENAAAASVAADAA
jgi:hypothetical protein